MAAKGGTPVSWLLDGYREKREEKEGSSIDTY